MALELSNPSVPGLLQLTGSLVDGLTDLSVHYRFMYPSGSVFDADDLCGIGYNFAVKVSPTSDGHVRLAREGTEAPANKKLQSATTANTWYSLLATFANGVLASDMRLYVDGVERTTIASSNNGDGAAVSPDGDVFMIAPVVTSGPNQKIRVADWGIWNVVLTAADAAALGAGAACRSIRPAALQFYAPLVRDVVDLRGAAAIVQNDGVAYDHPRVFGI